MSDLDRQLLAAHARGDGKALVGLYTEAAEAMRGTEAEWFFLTQAYVHALETAHDAAPALRARLADAGRETPEA